MNLSATTAARRISQKRAFSGRGGAAARFLGGIALVGAGSLLSPAAHAGNNAWSTAPGTNTFTGTQWTPGTVPGAASAAIASGDSLYFGTSSTTTLNNDEAIGFIIAGLTFNSDAAAYTIGGNNFTLTGGITNNSSTASQTISAKISGTNGLALAGVSGASATVSLSGANDYTGITTVSTGGRWATNATGLGSNAGATASALGTNYTQVNSGATVTVNNTNSEAFLINGTGSNSAGALRLGGNVVLNSFVQLGSDAAIAAAFSSGSNVAGNVDLAGHTLSWGTNGSNTINGTISGVISSSGAAGAGGINLAGGSNSVLTLTNNANTYTGTTTMGNNTTLNLGGDTVLGGSTLNLNSIVESANATARTIANPLAFGGSTVFGATATNTGTMTFTNTTATSIGNAVGKTLTTNVDTTFFTPLTGGAGAPLVKAGAAALILNGANTFAGTTTVSAGTLAVNGSLSAASAVTVAAGATLTGTGTVAGTVANSGTINAGGVGAVGALTTGAETFNTGSSLVFDFGNGAVDALTTSGILTGLNNATLTFTQITGSTGLTQSLYTLITASSFASGTTLPTSATTPAGYQLQLTGTSLNLVQTAAAPEPSQYAAFGIGLLGLGGLALRSRRRSRPAA